MLEAYVSAASCSDIHELNDCISRQDAAPTFHTGYLHILIQAAPTFDINPQ